MALKSGFFNSVNGDRRYNADDMSEYFEGLVSNGVYENVGDAMVVTAGSGMSVNVASGRAIINCKWLKNDSSYNVAINPASESLPRITAIVVRLNSSNRVMDIITADGTPASTPQPPVIPGDSLILAYVLIPANSSTISQSNITDTRPDTDICGWVTGLIDQVDTSELFLQWQAAYEQQFEEFKIAYDEWFDHLTQNLNVDTYLKEYSKREVLTSQLDNSIYLDMTGYTYEASDVINVYINGLHALNAVDYVLDTTGSVPKINTNAYADGTEVYISVMKSRIGFET